MSVMKPCPSCGADATPDARFCYRCGGKLEATQSPDYSRAGDESHDQDVHALPAPPGDSESGMEQRLDSQQSYQRGLAPSPSWPQPTQPAQLYPPPASVGSCLQHPAVAAVARCASCGSGICSTCDFVVPPPASSNSMLNLSGGMHLCPTCMAQRGRGPIGPPGLAPQLPSAQPVVPLGSGIMCVRHPGVAAVRRCHVCQAPMCQTCDFELPGFFHACPACATNPKSGMSSGRKRNLIISYVLAAWTTFGVIAMFAGIFAGLVKTKTDQQALGYVLFLFVYLPALIGTGLSVSSIDRKLGTPGAVWVSVLWNSFVLTVLVLLTLIGLLSKLG